MKKLISIMLLTSSVAFAAAPSFDCEKASTAVERLICSEGLLSHLDVQISNLYKKQMDDVRDDQIAVSSIRTEQREWIKEVRNNCISLICLKDTMEQRIVELKVPRKITLVEASPIQIVEQKQDIVIPHPSPEKEVVENILPKQDGVVKQSQIVEKKSGNTTQLSTVIDDNLWYIAFGALLISFIFAILLKNKATYFYNWYDLFFTVASLIGLVAILEKDLLVLSAFIVLNLVVGMLINRSLTKGILSGFGRLSGIIVFMLAILAGLISMFLNKNGKWADPELEKDLHKLQVRDTIVGAGIIGTFTYWIHTNFIGNARESI